MVKIKNTKLILLEVMIFVLFVANYIVITNKFFNYGYMSFNFQVNWLRVLIVILVTVMHFIIQCKIKKKFFACIWGILFVYLYFPAAIYFMFNDSNYKSYLAVIMLLIILAGFEIFKVRPIVFKRQSKSINSLTILIAISFIMLVPFVIYYKNSINIKNLLFIDIYDTRLKYREATNVFTAYLQSPLVRVIFPILFIKGLEKKKYLLTAYSAIGIIYVFLCGAVKSNLLIVPLLFAFYFGEGYISKLYIFIQGSLWLGIISLMEFLIFHTFYLHDIFLRRFFFVPPMLDNVMYNYFENNHLYWSYTRILSMFSHNEIGRNVALYVGENVIGQSNLNANTGFITEGFYSAGMLGVLLSVIAISIIISYIDSIKIEPKYFGMIFFYIYIFNTSTFETSMITHGLIVLLILAPIYMKKT